MKRLIGLVLAITSVIVVMLLALATPALNSGPHDLPLAVSGPAPAVAQLASTLDQQRPGAFATLTYATADEAADAIRDRDAIGGLALTADGVTVQTATGAGAPYAAVLKGLGAQLATSGQQVTYVELAPLPAGDPAGVGLVALGLPLIFGGVAGAAALRLGSTSSTTARLIAALALSAVSGLAASGVMVWLGALNGGAFWMVAGAFGAGIAAIAFTALGLSLALGPAGLGLTAALMLFVANPLSGLATGPAWLPQPWGEIGQYFPVGATGTALRSAAYFDGAGAGMAYAVLAAWVLGGLLLAGVSARRGEHERTRLSAASA